MCHDHSVLPEAWPALEDILGYREKVKKRITALYSDPNAMNSRTVMRALWIGFEHEGGKILFASQCSTYLV